MRIYLSVDMEGLAGVAHPHQVVHGRDGIDRADFGPRTVGFEAADGDAFYLSCLVLLRLAGVPVV